LPQSSVAIQVRVIVDSCGHGPPVIISVNVIPGLASQLSVAVADPVAAGNVLAVHAIVRFGGHVIEGAVVSVTTITCTHWVLLPHPSVAVQVLVIVISEGHAPETVTSLKVTAGLGAQLSVAVAVPVVAGNELWVHSIVTFTGHVIAGGKLSSTNMVCTQVLELPQSSVASHVRVIVLSCGHPPATVASVKVTVGDVSQLSVAVAIPVLAGAVLAVHNMVTFAGQDMDGATLSSTMMV
jgi:hypothetical protein